jgi:type III pantothenate kinase
MDINVLVVNVGNSRVAMGVFAAGELSKVRRVNLEDRANLPGVIKELWEEIAGGQMPAVAGASVNPTQMEWLEHQFLEITGQQVQWVGKDIDVPIDVLTEKPAATGIDRVLNIAAAYEEMGKACVVVDAGTAITVDCCNDKGQFIGGSISPGVSMMLDALHEKTAKLPRVQFAAPTEAFGKSTEQAILHGVYHGTRGMVKELVENYATDLGEWPEIIATGGDAQALFGGWELIHAVSPDLTLYGIALAYANHYIKHDSE